MFELQVAGPQIEDLLDACAGVEHGEQQGVVTPTVAGSAVGSLQQGLEFVRFEVLDEDLWGAFERHGEDLLAQFKVLGMVHRRVADEGVHGRQPSVARCDTVAALGLEVGQEREHMLGCEVGKVEPHHRTPVMDCEESQQQRNGVAVAEYGVAADATDLGQIISEEAPESSTERSRADVTHGRLRWPERRWTAHGGRSARWPPRRRVRASSGSRRSRPPRRVPWRSPA